MIPEADLVDLIRAVNSASERVNTTFFIVGALARDLLLKELIDLNKLRATLDVDFAFAVRNWAHYHALCQALLERAEGDFTKHGNEIQCLIFRRRIKVDLVPFAGVADPRGFLQWPPEGNPAMNVLGFEDAYASSVLVELPGTTIRVASLPALVILKLFAWNDRPSIRTKDIEDFALLLRQYHGLADEERLWTGDAADLREDPDFDYNHAWHRILGRDVGRVIQDPATAQCLLDILEREANVSPYQMAAILSHFLNNQSLESTLAVLRSFLQGVRDTLKDA